MTKMILSSATGGVTLHGNRPMRPCTASDRNSAAVKIYKKRKIAFSIKEYKKKIILHSHTSTNPYKCLVFAVFFSIPPHFFYFYFVATSFWMVNFYSHDANMRKAVIWNFLELEWQQQYKKRSKKEEGKWAVAL